MAKKTPWVMSLAVILSALGQHACKVCTCTEGPATELPNGAVAAAPGASSGGGSLAKNLAYTWKNVAILGGGFVSGIIFSPVEKDLVYARTDVGGVYRLNPADKTWIALTDAFERKSDYLGVESLAADPVDPNKVYIAVGMYTQAWAGYGAIFRSKDRGATWLRSDIPIKMGGNEDGRSNGERLAVDPHHPSILYFGSRKNGLWKSTDSGETWDQVNTFTATDSGNGVGIPVVVFDKQSGSKGKATPVIYAVVANKEGSLYHSTDAGATWKLVAKQPKGLMASHAEFDSTGALFLSYGNGPGPNDVTDGAIWKYQSKQDKFTNITPVAPKGEDKFGYGGLSVSASQPGTLMVSTIDRWSSGDEVYRSTDGGKTWKALLKKVVRDDAGAKYLYWHRAPTEPMGRGWMGDIDIDPFNPARAMYVTGQGIWASEDAAAADSDKPTHWTFLDRGLEETVVHGLVSPPAGPPLLSVMGDLCGFRHDDLNQPSAGGMFDNPICGSGTGIDLAWGKPDLAVWVGWQDKGQWGAVSLDAGKTWKPFKSMPKKAKGAGSIAVSADGSAFVWAPFESPVVYSKDQGATWSLVEGLPNPDKTPDWAPVQFRPAADRVNASKFYIFDAKGGQAYYSTDGGAHFTASPNGLPNLADYELGSSSARAVPGIEGDVWITSGKELNHSTDSGKTWETIDSVEVAHGIGFGKPADGKKYPALYLVGKVG
ncbi:MAG TPA: carbohydrate-binding protein, partial [Polyangia bacterium]